MYVSERHAFYRRVKCLLKYLFITRRSCNLSNIGEDTSSYSQDQVTVETSPYKIDPARQIILSRVWQLEFYSGLAGYVKSPARYIFPEGCSDRLVDKST